MLYLKKMIEGGKVKDRYSCRCEQEEWTPDTPRGEDGLDHHPKCPTDKLRPMGLCAQRGDHEPHEHDSPTLGKFWCTGREFDRQPGKAEKQRRRDG